MEVGPRNGAVYETLRGQISSALWSSRLAQYLRLLYEASNDIRSLQEPGRVRQAVVEKARQAVGAKGANVVILDVDGRWRRRKYGRFLVTCSAILIGRPAW